VAALIAVRHPTGTLPGIVALGAAAGIAAAAMLDMDAFATGLQFPRQKIAFRANSPYGKLLVIEAAGQYDFMENGVPLFSTHDYGRIEETVHYAMIQRPDARKVLLVSGGALVAFPLVFTLSNRPVKHLYVSVWYMGAALFVFPTL